MKNFLNIASWWLAVFLWAGFIFWLSSIPNLRSGLPTNWDLILRKTLHITEYFFLTFLIFGACSQGHNLPIKKALITSGIIALLYAASDELHQSFVIGRHGGVTDVLIDSLGIGGYLGLIIKRRLSFTN